MARLALARDEQVNQQYLTPRVVTGAERFQRAIFYSGEGLGNISEIRVGWPADREGALLTVVGNEGVHFLDANSRLVKELRFSKDVFTAMQVVQRSADDYGYLTRDESWASPAVLFDRNGQVVWSYSSGLWQGIDDSVALGTDGGESVKVAVGLNGGGGLVLLNERGETIWRRPEANVWHVEALDTSAEGHAEILHSDAEGQLLVRNISGDVMARYLHGSYVSNFTITRWEGSSQPDHILVPVDTTGDSEPNLFVLDAGGRTVARLEAPLRNLMHSVNGVPVRYREAGYYYAVVLAKGASPRSELLIYDKDGQIAYQEILGEHCLGLAALPGPSGERLLVGCSDKILEYSPYPR